MDDLISRQAAIDALHKKRIETMEKGQDVNHIWECLDVVAQVPSAQPDIARSIATIIENEKDMRVILASKPSAQQWIPCSERLPEEENVYLVTFDKSCLLDNEMQVTNALWIDNQWQYDLLESYEHRMPKLVIEPIEELKVIAWMSLPEPYKGEES